MVKNPTSLQLNIYHYRKIIILSCIHCISTFKIIFYSINIMLTIETSYFNSSYITQP